MESSDEVEVNAAVQEAVSWAHSLLEQRSPEPPFPAQADRHAMIGAILAQVIYEQADAGEDSGKVQQRLEQRANELQVMRILDENAPSAEMICRAWIPDHRGRPKVAFFLPLHADYRVSWMVARGSTSWSDWLQNIFFVAPGHVSGSPDFHKLRDLYDAKVKGYHGYTHIAVGHSKAGAEVVELALQRENIQAHAFNDGGLLNVRWPKRGSSILCHRIHGDLVCNRRWDVGAVRYYPRDPCTANPHSIRNFTNQRSTALCPHSRAWFGPLAATSWVYDDEGEDRAPVVYLHPSLHAARAAGVFAAAVALSGCSRWSSWTAALSLAGVQLGRSWIGGLPSLGKVAAVLVYPLAIGAWEAGLCWWEEQQRSSREDGASKFAKSREPDKVPLWLERFASASTSALCQVWPGAFGVGSHVFLTAGRIAYDINCKCFEWEAALRRAAHRLACLAGASLGHSCGACLGSCLLFPCCLHLQGRMAVAVRLPLDRLLREWLSREFCGTFGAQLGGRLFSAFPVPSLISYASIMTVFTSGGMGVLHRLLIA
mmetsp:Transcript_70900/g.169777  ORF Transcript_70900/g.169777 Transcript_70900/m.169777 type:complete len:542 (+) Transcript_70900:83-1708(+)|eukprot:CAMPEP_0178390656 /NCGR_PEP_ID=MMETSP0689_2-20121128/10758_1 /TAXON_ID=160604 /ORGANISM="Amphidinium massartii, Strain CS-259" /LENGTH=541 /DNA_ID=CAMNT_0020011171 /DNA_START=18 /DNA_END=1643 /DNA_ORIENTATION=+